MPFVFGVRFILALGVARVSSRSTGKVSIMNYTPGEIVQVGKFGTWAQMEMNSIGGGDLPFLVALTFRLWLLVVFFFTRRKIPSTDR